VYSSSVSTGEAAMGDESEADQVRRVKMVEAFRSSLSSQISVAMTYLHNTTNWSLTIFAAGVGASVVQGRFPSDHSHIIISIILVVLAHFFVRTCKAYINVMRFTSLDKLMLANISTEEPARSYDLIDRYYIQWVCPISIKIILVKTLFELGFAYMWGVLLSLSIYALFYTGPAGLFVLIFAHGIAACEFYFSFLRSPYVARVEPLEIATSQR
jgi:hypothetical protein